MKTKRAIVSFVVFVGLFTVGVTGWFWIPPMKAYATTPIASPTSYSISSVTVYSPALETNDQLYIINGSITYGVNPTEDAGQAWLVRLLSANLTELASTTIYPYYNAGYAAFVTSIYLPASIAPTWAGNYTVSLEPNPTLTWISIPAQSLFTAITWNSASTIDAVATAVGSKIRALALNLNTAWVSPDLIESVNGLLKLTSYGAGYFDVSIPILRTVQPNLYQSNLNSAILVDNKYGNTYQQNVDSNLVGTPFDPTALAASIGLSRMWTTGLIWFLFCILLSGLVGYFSQSTKPVFFLFGALMIAGSFMGFGLLQGIMFGLLGGGSLVLAFAWRGA